MQVHPEYLELGEYSLEATAEYPRERLEVIAETDQAAAQQQLDAILDDSGQRFAAIVGGWQGKGFVPTYITRDQGIGLILDPGESGEYRVEMTFTNPHARPGDDPSEPHEVHWQATCARR